MSASDNPVLTSDTPDNILNNNADLRIVRTFFNTPRNRAILEVTTNDKNMHINGMGTMYFITIRDRGLRTLDNQVCAYNDALKLVGEWLEQYDCKIYKTENVVEKKRCNLAAF
jgi:hypothetical protein